jgi:hypothetical protein
VTEAGSRHKQDKDEVKLELAWAVTAAVVAALVVVAEVFVVGTVVVATARDCWRSFY